MTLYSLNVLKRMLPLAMACLMGTGLSISLSGCRDYLDRTDAISLDAGNAVAENKAAHIIDPWPPGAFKKHQTTSGERLLKAHEQYETNKKRISEEPDQKTAEQ